MSDPTVPGSTVPGSTVPGIAVPGIAVGEVVAERSVHLTRESLVRYAGASGDVNPIHYRDDIAVSVGLPGVLAHGMLTMGIAIATLEQWLGDPARIVECGVRFTRPVLVDSVSGADVHVSAKVAAIEPQPDAPDLVRIDLTVTAAALTVLGKAQVRVRSV